MATIKILKDREVAVLYPGKTKLIPSDDPRKVYLETGENMRYVFENGVLVGFYRPKGPYPWEEDDPTFVPGILTE